MQERMIEIILSILDFEQDLWYDWNRGRVSPPAIT